MSPIHLALMQFYYVRSFNEENSLVDFMPFTYLFSVYMAIGDFEDDNGNDYRAYCLVYSWQSARLKATEEKLHVI